MTITPRINEYGHKVADCPFCPGWVYVRETSKTSPDPLRDLKRHITNQAKNEALERHLQGEDALPSDEPPHLHYYRKHTLMRPQRSGEMKRQYDADMSLC